MADWLKEYGGIALIAFVGYSAVEGLAYLLGVHWP